MAITEINEVMNSNLTRDQKFEKSMDILIHKTIESNLDPRSNMPIRYRQKVKMRPPNIHDLLKSPVEAQCMELFYHNNSQDSQHRGVSPNNN